MKGLEYMFKKNDLILLGGIFIIALVVIVIINFTKTEGDNIVILKDGKVYETLDLNKNTTFTITEDNGAYNIITIQDGWVFMTEADCRDKICVKHSKIRYNGESIVCLPHKLVVEIHNGESNDVDIIAK